MLCLATRASAADDITGVVTSVPNGDTLMVTVGATTLEVRLADIGAPQGSEYYASASRTLLANITSGKNARIILTDRDGAKRVFGRAFVGPLNVNLELVQRGAAWMCWEYATDTSYAPYENDAIRHRRGLWYETSAFDARIRCRSRPSALKPVGKP